MHFIIVIIIILVKSTDSSSPITKNSTNPVKLVEVPERVLGLPVEIFSILRA